MSSQSRVFVTQESAALNYSNAETFGELVFLTRDEVSPVPNSLTNEAIKTQMEEKLADFDFANDYIAPSGSPIVSGLAFFILGRNTENEGFPAVRCLRCLRWSNRDRVYQPITFNL